MTDFSDPNYLVGIRNPMEKEPEDTSSSGRSFPRAVADVALQTGQAMLGIPRMASTVGLEFAGDKTPAQRALLEFDKTMHSGQEALNTMVSPRGRAVIENQWLGNDPDKRSAWKEPMATIAAQATGLAPSIATGLALGPVAGLAAAGVQGATDPISNIRDWIHDPKNQATLDKLPAYQDQLRRFDGDADAAKEGLVKDSTDVWDWMTNAAANMVEFGAVKHALSPLTPAKRELAGFLRRTFGGQNLPGRIGVGFTEGFVGGAAEGAAGETTNQRARVKMGAQDAVNLTEILNRTGETAMSQAFPLAGLQAGRFSRTTPIGTEQQSVAQQQTQPAATPAPAAPPAPTVPQALNTGAPPAGGTPFTQGPEMVPEGGLGAPVPQGVQPAGTAPAPAAASPGVGIAAQPPWVTPQAQPAKPTRADQLKERQRKKKQAEAPAPPPQMVSPPEAAELPAGVPMRPDGTPMVETPVITQPQEPVTAQPQPVSTPEVAAAPREPVTVYIDPVGFDDTPFRAMQDPRGPAREIAFDETTGQWGVRRTDGPKAGQFYPQLYFNADTQPRPGLQPVTVGRGVLEYGNEVQEGAAVPQLAPQEAPAQAPQQAPQVTETPHAAPKAPEVTRSLETPPAEIAAPNLRTEPEAKTATPADKTIPPEQRVIGRNTAGEEIVATPDGHRKITNADGTTFETMHGGEMGGTVHPRLLTAEETAAGTSVPSPGRAPSASETEARDRLKQRAVEIAKAKEDKAAADQYALTPEQQAVLDSVMNKAQIKSPTQRAVRSRELKRETSARIERQGGRTKDVGKPGYEAKEEALKERAKTDEQRLAEANAKQAAELEKARQTVFGTGGNAAKLQELKERLQRNKAERAAAREEAKKLAPKGVQRMTLNAVKRYVKSKEKTAAQWRAVRKQVMELPPDQRDKAIKRMGPMPSEGRPSPAAYEPSRRVRIPEPRESGGAAMTKEDFEAQTAPKIEKRDEIKVDRNKQNKRQQDQILAQLYERRGMDARAFFLSPYVKRALNELDNLNKQRRKRLPMPDWLRAKFDELTAAQQKKNSEFAWLSELKQEEAPAERKWVEPPGSKEEQAAERAAAEEYKKTEDYAKEKLAMEVATRQAKEPSVTNVRQMAEEHLPEREAELRRRITRRAYIMDIELKKGKPFEEAKQTAERVVPLVQTHTVGRGARTREVTEYFPTREEIPALAQEYVQKFYDDKAQLEATQGTRNRRYELRENAINMAVKDVIAKHGGDKAVYRLLQLARGFVRDERYPEVHPGTGLVHPAAWKGLELKYPTPPKILARQDKGKLQTKLSTNTPLDVQEERVAKAEQAYERRVENYWRTKTRQLAAAHQLQPIMQEMLDRVRAEIELVKQKEGIEGRSISMDLPDVSITKDVTESGQKPRLNVGKGGKASNQYKMMIEVLKSNEYLKDILAGTDVKRFQNLNWLNEPLTQTVDTAREMQTYMNRLDQVAESAVLDLQAFIRGDIDSMAAAAKERRDIKNAGISAAFNETSSWVQDKEGEWVDSLSDATSSATVMSASRSSPSWQEIEARGWKSGLEAQAQARAEATQLDRLKELLRQAKSINNPVRAAQLQELVDRVQAVVDRHNANRLNMPIHPHPPQSIAEVAKEIEDARQELDTAYPVSPLISEPQTVGDLIDRVKRWVSEGHATFSSFVDDTFLDKLTKLVGDVEVLHTTSDVTGGNFNYDPRFDRIVMVTDAPYQSYAQGAVHEMAHAVTYDLLESDADFSTAAYDLLRIARDAAVKRGLVRIENGKAIGLPDHLYGLTTRHEMLAESWSNQKFRDFLDSVQAPTKQPNKPGRRTVLTALWGAIKRAWQKVMGTQRDADTALDILYYTESSVLGNVDLLSQNLINYAETVGRRRPMAEAEYLDGAPLNMASRSKRFEQGAQGPERGPSTWAKMKAIWDSTTSSLALHTGHDLTQKLNPEFNEKAEDVLDVAARIHRERTRILEAEDQPLLIRFNQFLNSLSRTNRMMVEDFIIDETMHGAFADAELHTGKNKHVTRDGLADEQIRMYHQQMRDRYDALKNFGGEVVDINGVTHTITFKEMRDELHEFFGEREEQIREVVIKHILERSALIPDSVTGAARDDAVNRLKAYIFADPNLDTEQLREFRKDERTKLRADYGINLGSQSARKQLQDLRNEEALKRIKGPYYPLSRHGDYAVYGQLLIPTPEGAERLGQKTHWQTGWPTDDGTYLFRDKEDLRTALRQWSEEYGISQIGGGEMWIDERTGERAMKYTPEELDRLREEAEAKGEPEPVNKRLTEKEIQEGLAAGKPYRHRYFVTIQPKILEYHQNKADAQASINEWKARYGDRIDMPSEPEDVQKKTGKENDRAVSDTLQRVIDGFEQSPAYRRQPDAEQAALKTAITLQAAKRVMGRGVRARFSTRNYVQGANRDVIVNAADYSGSTAGYLAKMKHMTEADAVTKSLRDYVHDMRHEKDHMRRTQVMNELFERMHRPAQSLKESVFSRNVERLLQWTMLDKLFGIGYFTANATQPGMVAAPLMAGEHGVDKVAKEMATAYAMFGPLKFVGRGISDMWKAARNRRDYTNWPDEFRNAVRGKTDEAELVRLHDYLADRGLFEATAGVEYQRLLMLASRNKIDQAGDYLSNIFQGGNTAVENISRFVTATTAYRLARQAGQTEAQAQKYARRIMYEGMGQYANFNAPELFNRNPAFKMMFQFRKYPQMIIADYFRAAAGSLGAVKALARGQRPTNEQIMRARQFAFMLGIQGLFAGLYGLPTEPFSIPINALNIAGAIDFNWEDVEAWGRQELTSQFGKGGGEAVAHGILRPLTGTDFASRLSQSGMIFNGSPGSTKTQDLQRTGFGMLTGAGGSTFFEAIKGLQTGAQAIRAYNAGADDVAYKKAWEAGKLLFPVRFISDVMDAIQPNEDLRRGRAERSTAEAILGVTGIRSAREAEESKAKGAIRREVQRTDAERKEITDLWVKTPPAQRAQLQDRIDRFNLGKEDAQKIKRQDLLQAQARAEKTKVKDQSTMGLNVSKRNEPVLKIREAYNF